LKTPQYTYPVDLTKSKALQLRAERVIPGGVNSPVRAFKAVGGDPPFIVRAKGARMWDADGNEYIDYVGSWGTMILGHAHPAVIAGIEKAARDGVSFGASTPSEAELAEIVKDELNVKAIEVRDAAEGLVKETVKPDLKVLGPKLGKDLPRVRQALAGMEHVQAGPTFSESKEHVAHDHTFHTVIVQAPGNSVLLEMYQSLNLHMHLSRLYYGRGVAELEQTRHEHRVILDAYEARRALPQRETVRFPGDTTSGTRAGPVTPQGIVADYDLVVSTLVDAASHSPDWCSTAIFVLEDEAQEGPEHVERRGRPRHKPRRDRWPPTVRRRPPGGAGSAQPGVLPPQRRRRYQS